MKNRIYQLCPLLLAGFLAAAALTGCNPEKAPETGAETTRETELRAETETEATASPENLGSFTLTDINGESFTEEMFQDYDLTLVNVFATWCSPCINEIPDLQKLSEELADKNVRVVGIILDAAGGSGDDAIGAVETAKMIAEKTGASYPFLIPDETNLNGRLDNINAVPETFFVDRNGNIVGETYVGSHSLEEWKAFVEEELSKLAE